MTEEEKHIDTIKMKLYLCKIILKSAERIDKGKHADKINQLVIPLRSKLEKLLKCSFEKITTKEIEEVCKLRKKLADGLCVIL